MCNTKLINAEFVIYKSKISDNIYHYTAIPFLRWLA